MYRTKKFNDWLVFYTDKNNTQTYGNATQSAIKAYGYNKKQYGLASAVGSKNIKKYKVIALAELEKNDITVGKMLRVLAKKAMEGSYEECVDFMYRLGVFDSSPLEKKQRKLVS